MDNQPISSPIPALQILQERSTHLSSQLNELSLKSPQFHIEIERLARQLENLPNITRTTIAWISTAVDVPSKLAIKDVTEISEHCNKATDRLNTISTSIQHQYDQAVEETYPADILIKKEIIYLTYFFDAMSLTLNAMVHAFHVLQSIKDGA